MAAARTCLTCGYYSVRRRVCTAYDPESPTLPDAQACGRYIPMDGSMPPDLPTAVNEQPARPQRPPDAYRGSTRAAVLALAAQGLSSAVIAERLGVSRQLVNYHKRMQRKRALGELDGHPVVMTVATPVSAKRLAQVLAAACEAWGELQVEAGTHEVRLVRNAASRPKASGIGVGEPKGMVE